MRDRDAGVTLLELLIVLAIITILGMIAVVSYSQYVVRAGRADAKAALVRLAQQQERYYTTHRRYITNDAGLVELGFPEKASEEGYYQLSIAPKGNGGYELTATAKAAGPQFARDPQCRRFSLDHTGAEAAFSATGADTTRECWGG